MEQKQSLKILVVSAEVVPFAKSGGLADVAGSLPQVLAAKGNDVRIVMPRYREITQEMHYITDFPVQMDWRRETCIIRRSQIGCNSKGETKEIPVYFVDSYHYFDREGMYCHLDDGERFAFFCKAVLHMLPKINFQPDVIHCNDWHTGPITFLLKHKFKTDPFYKNIATVFTIHNLQYQGNYSKDILKVFDIDESYFNPEQLEFYGRFSFIKTGILYADVINAVSETYAKEIQTPEFGELLDGVLRKRSKDLYGIVNGIGTEQFNPNSDPMIYKNYDVNHIELKKDNKHGLQKEAGLPLKDVPLIGLVHRLVEQKGLDLIIDVFDELMNFDVQFVVLGLGDPYYERMFKKLQEKYPDKVATFFEFNEALAHKIYAGSDIFLMPSRFEPCGLGQLISLKYGTIPIVRAVGGLVDTIQDFNLGTATGNGFVFEEYSPEAFFQAVKRCLSIYNDRKDLWDNLVKSALTSDYSWDKQAEKYIHLFRLATEKNKLKIFQESCKI
ncbi:MAG: starch synthase [Petroclostridium sp.]|nr:starch synthase [Petroclostridium sp.]